MIIAMIFLNVKEINQNENDIRDCSVNYGLFLMFII